MLNQFELIRSKERNFHWMLLPHGGTKFKGKTFVKDLTKVCDQNDMTRTILVDNNLMLLLPQPRRLILSWYGIER